MKRSFLSHACVGGLLVGAVHSLSTDHLPDGRFFMRTDADYGPQEYRGIVATFGDRLLPPTKVNLMLPPQPNLDLCTFPSSFLENEETRKRVMALNERIALLVPIGNCPPEAKALTMVKIQRELSSFVNVLMIYETNRARRGRYVSLTASDEASLDPGLNNVAMVYIPVEEAERLNIVFKRNRSGSSVLGDPESESWSFRHTITGIWDPSSILRNDRNREFEPDDDYIWIRYILFCLLILSPCFRAAYLFYAGGGRIRFRRNEDGRVTGLMYIPPMPYWLSHGPRVTDTDPKCNSLTEEQFDALPEVVYKALPPAGENNDTPEQTETIEREPTHHQTSEEITDPEVGDNIIGESSTMPAAEVVSQDGPIEVDVIPHPEKCNGCQMVPMFFSKASDCSICIDDFEEGEKLILLPRCDHVFHRECIKPWLLERQGRCPLCKTGVINDDHDTVSDQSVIESNVSR